MTVTEASAASQRRFDEYIGRLASAMGHADRLAPLHLYCTGLLVTDGRKSVEPITARVAPDNVRQQHQSLLHLVADSPWDDADVLRAIRDYVLPPLVEKSRQLAGIVDDTGIVKKGKHSVGVAHQYCGQVGKNANCQVAVSLSLANEFGSLPMAHRLYLPEDWANDPERRKKCKVPDDIVFQTKLEIAIAQVEDALRAGIPLSVILADAAYGNDTAFRDRLTDLKIPYCVGITSSTTVWAPGTAPLPPGPYKGNGRPPTRLRRDADHKPVSVNALAMSLSKKAYAEVAWREGTKGRMKSRFAAVRVVPAHRDERRTEPRPEEWLLVEWPDGEDEPTKYTLSTLPPTATLKHLVRTTKGRWRVERDYQELKDEIGLGHYEGRGWRGFHHHATLCIAAYAFLMRERLFSPSGDSQAKPQVAAPEVPEGYRPRGTPDAA